MNKYVPILIALSLLFFNCGKGDNTSSDNFKIRKKTDKKIAKTNKTKFSNFEIDKEGNRLPEIKIVEFTGKAFENKDLHADVHLSIPSDNIDLRFQWIVNDEIIEGIDTEILPKENFKQGDWVFCKVKILDEDYDTPEIKSKYVKIIGLTPVLNMGPIPEISIPGEFRYKINASLPGQETDNEDLEEGASDDFPQDNGLEFILISPTDKEIFIDPSSGEIIWNITEEIATSLSGAVEIKFKVSNPKGGSISSSIKLSFKTSETDKEQ